MISSDALNITEKAAYDNSITKVEYHSYQSYGVDEVKYNDECRIVIQQQDLITVPGESFLQIQGKLQKHGAGGLVTKCQLINNFVALMFEEIRYEMGGVLIDRVKNPGITTSMKNYVSQTPHESVALMNAGWVPFDDNAIFDASTGCFDVCWPLSMFLGFAEDYKKAIINVRQELVLIRATNDLNATIERTETEKGDIKITKIIWKVPHYSVNDLEKLKLLNIIEKNLPIQIAHRRWELFTYPALQKTYSFTWVLKASTFLEKPRFVIFGFQTDRKQKLKADQSKFDHCNLKNVRLYLNAQSYPYENLNLSFKHHQFALAYDMYAKFQQSYYANKKMLCEPLFNPDKYKTAAPLIVIDCSHQNEALHQGTVDARLEFETEEDVPDKTAAFCLVLHEQFVSYEPLTGRVRIA